MLIQFVHVDFSQLYFLEKEKKKETFISDDKRNNMYPA